MKINITGDFYINDKVKEPSRLIENMTSFFNNSDFNIINLESPITESIKTNKIIKVGPHLNGHPETYNILKGLHVNLVTLANNHIMDFGDSGLNDTLKGLQENSISYVGAGINLEQSSKAYTLNKEGIRIAILNFTENEWSIAEENNPGANPLDIIENVKQIKEVRKTHDKVILIIHGGHEYYHLPSPRMVKQYRFYAENGADVIVGHHSHCISGYEIYNDIPIFYSLGNFLFTKNSKYECWYNGLVLQLVVSENKKITFELHPLVQRREDFHMEFMTGDDKIENLERINRYNILIADKKLIQQNWNDFLNAKSKQYLNSFSPINIIGNRYIRAGFRRLNFNKLLMNKKYLKEILNAIRCEAHIDVSKEIIMSILKK